MHTHTHTHTQNLYRNFCCSFMNNHQNMERTQMLFKGWVNKVHIHMVENTQILWYMTTWMNFKDITLRERSYPRKITSCMRPCIWSLEKIKITGIENRGMAARGLSEESDHKEGTLGNFWHFGKFWLWLTVTYEPTTIYTYSKKKKSNKYISWLWQKLQGSIHMSKLT